MLKSLRPHLPLRPTALLAALFLFFSANAQQTYDEAAVTHADRNGQRIWLHEGTPLQGLCRINYMDIDFVPRYWLSRFRDGVRSDTVSYCSARTGKLLRTVIRLGDKALHIRDYDRCDGSCLREWTEVDGRMEGTLKVWYAEGKPRFEEEYKAGKRHGVRREWDESGRLTAQVRYRDEAPEGAAKRWRYEGPDWGEIKIAYHQTSDRPYMVERYAFWQDQQGLIERTVPDGEGATLYRADKQDCDSTRIDTLYGERMIVEIRDFREGSIRSLERYDAAARSGTLLPHGVFELYAPDGRIGTRMRYEEGELVRVRDYDEAEEPRTDVRTTLLSRAEGDRLLAETFDSKYLTGCDDTKPLRIYDREGELIMALDEENRRYEYHGYDPELKFHEAFSSVGDWNDVRWYVVYDNDRVHSVMECGDSMLAVNGKTGLIASAESWFEGELDLTVHRFFPHEEAGGNFEPVFFFTLTDLPPVWGMHWVGENTLLLVMEKSCIRLDIDPESFEGYEGELY